MKPLKLKLLFLVSDVGREQGKERVPFQYHTQTRGMESLNPCVGNLLQLKLLQVARTRGLLLKGKGIIPQNLCIEHISVFLPSLNAYVALFTQFWYEHCRFAMFVLILSKICLWCILNKKVALAPGFYFPIFLWPIRLQISLTVERAGLEKDSFGCQSKWGPWFPFSLALNFNFSTLQL